MLKTVLIGATGVVGQQFILALQNHPWFELTSLAASSRSAGKKYRNAIKDPNGASRWFCKESPPSEVLDQTIENGDEINPANYDIAFSALESSAARNIEPRFAALIPVVSTASAFRYEDDVPILMPGVNEDHIPLLKEEKRKRGWKGFIAPQPNCTTVGLCMTLKPIQDTFGLESIVMTSLQAISGAGRTPGVSAMDVVDNVIPFIPQEEEKVQKETLKILGRINGSTITPSDARISCTCTRVNVTDGHTETVLVVTKASSDRDGVKSAMKAFSKKLADQNLPSAPKELLTISDDPFRPQPRLDRETDDGMTTTVGRIRSDDSFERGIKYVLVSHNTKMGAAKGAVLSTEMLVKAKII